MNSKPGSVTFERRYLAITLGFLLITAVLLVALVHLRQLDFVNNQQALMAAMTRSTANEISLLVSNYRRSVRLFAEDNRELLSRVVASPQDESALIQLQERVRRHFTNSFGMTVATSDGQVLIDDFDGLVGEICVRDLQHFAISKRPYEIFVHPHASVYHFDMPVFVNGIGREPVVFFISFKLDEIARLLANGVPPGHRFVVVNADDPVLIEVTEKGSRAQLGEHIRLDEETSQSVGFRRKIDNTNWLLLDIPESGLFSAHLGKLVIQAIVIFVLVAVGSLLIFVYLQRETTRRKITHSRLMETNRQLTSTSARLLETEKMASLGGLLVRMVDEVVSPLDSTRSLVKQIAEHSTRLQRHVIADRIEPGELESYIEQVNAACRHSLTNLEHMDDLLKDFDALASLQNQLEVRTFKLGQHIRSVLEGMDEGLSRAQVRWSLGCEHDFEIQANPGALALVITHLVLNSLHAGNNRDSHSDLYLDVIKSGNDAIIRYRDTSTTVSADVLDKLLGQANSPVSAQGGDHLLAANGFSVFNALVRKLLNGRTEIDGTKKSGLHISLFIPMDIRQAN